MYKKKGFICTGTKWDEFMFNKMCLCMLLSPHATLDSSIRILR